MPLLNVSFMTTDPMLADTFDVRRRLNVVGDDGRVTAVPDKFFPKVTGVVTQQDGRTLMRAEDGQSYPMRIMINSPFQLIAATKDNQPDEVTWNGVLYTVESQLPYSRFGAGHYCVILLFRGVIPPVAQ